MSTELPKVELPNADKYEYCGVNVSPAMLYKNTRIVFANVTNRKIDRLLELDPAWGRYFKLKEVNKKSKKADK